jgi:hypothetical protein
VFVVIDAFEVEGIVPGALAPPVAGADPETFEQYCVALESAVKAHLRELALSRLAPERRSAEEARFHPHVLFWERESVILAGADTLAGEYGLVLPEDKVTPEGLRRTRNPSRVMADVYRARGGKYHKAIDGPRLLGAIARDYVRWPRLLNRLPGLDAIIRDLVEL